MGKLILQMHVSIDGFMARKNGDVDWVMQERDDELLRTINELHASVTCIIMGRKMAEGFVVGWTSGLASTEPSDALTHKLARKMVETPKIVFSNTLENIEWENTTLEKGDCRQAILQLKEQSEGDIIVFGGASFVSTLIKQKLIDEYNFLVNPVALGEGMAAFNGVQDDLNMQLVKTKGFGCGVVLARYEPND